MNIVKSELALFGNFSSFLIDSYRIFDWILNFKISNLISNRVQENFRQHLVLLFINYFYRDIIIIKSMFFRIYLLLYSLLLISLNVDHWIHKLHFSKNYYYYFPNCRERFSSLSYWFLLLFPSSTLYIKNLFLITFSASTDDISASYLKVKSNNG